MAPPPVDVDDMGVLSLRQSQLFVAIAVSSFPRTI